MKPKYRIKWQRVGETLVRSNYFHTDYIIQFVAKLKAIKSIVVLAINKV